MRDDANGTLAAVRRLIDENRLLTQGDQVIVALSGGADSVALLHILISLKEIYNCEISAAHFHHGIRGAEADRDLTFVTELCKKWGIPLYYEKADVPAVAAQTGESTELCGRRLRYQFLEELSVSNGGAKIATAHQRGDNAETVLWNLTRGSGIGGLCGIPVRRGAIIRPLLCLSREEIEDYCRKNALAYVTDSTNLSDAYTRNRLRRQVMPVLRELNPGAEENIARTAALMREAEAYFNRNADDALQNAWDRYGYSCQKLSEPEPIILQYAVKKVLENAGAPVDFRHIALIIEAMRSGGAVQLGGGFTADCAQGLLRVYHAADHEKTDFCVPFGEYLRSHGARITLRGGEPDLTAYPSLAGDGEKIHNLLSNHGIPCAIMTPDTVVRTRRAGDVFTDARRGVTKTLKKWMNEMKIPREERDAILLVADGSTVLWISGYGTAAQAKADLTRDGDLVLFTGV